jgi:hypothetical protein
MGWKDDARRTIISEKKELETFPGYWVKVRKYSIRGKDEINAAVRRMQQSLDKKALYSLAKKVKEQSGRTDLSEEEVMGMLEPEEIGAFMDSNSVPLEEINKLKILHGVAAHNFVDGDKDVGTDDPKAVKVFADDILEYSDIVAELLRIIEEYNRPLAQARSKTSRMSQSGSTTEQTSNPETNSRTDEDLQS